MSVSTEKLKSYQSYKTESNARLQKLKDEANNKQKQIDADNQKYHELVVDGKDDEAVKLLGDIEQMQRELKYVSDKAGILAERERDVKGERVQSVLDEFVEVKSSYQNAIQKEEQALEKMKASYVKKVNEIMELHTELQQASNSYIAVAEQNGRNKDAIKMRVSPVGHKRYEIDPGDLINGGK